MLKLEPICLYGKTEDALDVALERYNKSHTEQLSYQDFCKQLLEDAIRKAARLQYGKKFIPR